MVSLSDGSDGFLILKITIAHHIYLWWNDTNDSVPTTDLLTYFQLAIEEENLVIWHIDHVTSLHNLAPSRSIRKVR